MRVTWLGQGGLYIETDSGKHVMIDPYLSNSLEKEQGDRFKRLVKIDKKYLTKKVDVLALTHSHEDHTDVETLDYLLSGDNQVEIISPVNVMNFIRNNFGETHKYIMFSHGVEVTVGDIWFRSIYAVHSDNCAVGFLIKADDKTIYVTGDTLYSGKISDCIDVPVDYMFTVINGAGNNMNAVDAKRLTDRINPKNVVPIHWDMFKDYYCAPGAFIRMFDNSNINAFILEEYEQLDL